MKKTSTTPETGRSAKQNLPPGWDEQRIKDVIDYYENQTEEEQLADHEKALAAEVPLLFGPLKAALPPGPGSK